MFSLIFLSHWQEVVNRGELAETSAVLSDWVLFCLKYFSVSRKSDWRKARRIERTEARILLDLKNARLTYAAEECSIENHEESHEEYLIENHEENYEGNHEECSVENHEECSVGNHEGCSIENHEGYAVGNLGESHVESIVWGTVWPLLCARPTRILKHVKCSIGSSIENLISSHEECFLLSWLACAMKHVWSILWSRPWSEWRVFEHVTL